MKSGTHAAFALVLGSGALLLFLSYEKTPVPFEFLGYALSRGIFSGIFLLLAVIGARTPDFLEPAFNNRHRSFFHSRKLGILLLGFIVVLLLLMETFVYFSPFLVGFLTGYISHLLLDALTPAGLPK